MSDNPASDPTPIDLATQLVADFVEVCNDRDNPAYMIKNFIEIITAYMTHTEQVLGTGAKPPADIYPDGAPIGPNGELPFEEFVKQNELSFSVFKYWVEAFTTSEAIDAESPEATQQIRDLVIKYICIDNPESKSPFDIGQAMMKAAIHSMWRKNFLIRTARITAHTDPREAIRVVITPRKRREVEFFQELMVDIAAKGDSQGGFPGETIEEMMARICP
jgi:hypothetical protein